MRAVRHTEPTITGHTATILPFQSPYRLDSDFARGSLAGHSRVFEAREYLFEEGDAAKHVFLIESGHVCIYRLMSDGRRQIVDVAYPGDIVGLGGLVDHDANAVATERTCTRSFPVSALDEIVRYDREFGPKLFKALSQQLRGAHEMLLTVGRRTAPERLASFLVALSRRNGREGRAAREFVLPMSRVDIADFLALTIETVSRTFSKFRAEGLIKIEQNILITIRDMDALENLADGSDG